MRRCAVSYFCVWNRSSVLHTAVWRVTATSIGVWRPRCVSTAVVGVSLLLLYWSCVSSCQCWCIADMLIFQVFLHSILSMSVAFTAFFSVCWFIMHCRLSLCNICVIFHAFRIRCNTMVSYFLFVYLLFSKCGVYCSVALFKEVNLFSLMAYIINSFSTLCTSWWSLFAAMRWALNIDGPQCSFKQHSAVISSVTVCR